MADVTPIRVVVDGSGDTTGLSEFLSGETLGLIHGGTGATTATGAISSLGLHAVAVSGSYTDLLNKPTTDNILEGTTNLYYTDARVTTYLGDNSYVTQTYVDTAISNMLDGAPGVLDTLNELAAAIGDDANFATTINTNITGVQTNVDALFGTKSTSDLSEGTNKYFTDERVDDRVSSLISGGTGIASTYNDSGNLLTLSVDFTEFDADEIVEGSVNKFFNGKSTTDLTEGTNKYYTDERVDDRVGTLIVGGTNISTNYSDVNNRLTLNLDSTGGFTFTNNSTSDLQEGSNLYFTNARADARVAAGITSNGVATESYVLSITNPINSALNAEISATNADITTVTTSVTSETSRATAKENAIQSDLDDEIFDRETAISNISIGSLTNVDLSTAPTNNQSLIWDNANSKFIAGDSFSQSNFDSSFAAKSTTNLSEGTNLYFTNARALAATDGQIVKFANMFATVAELPSATTYHGMFAHVHATNKGYFAHAGGWKTLIDESSSTTTDLSEGTNLYYTQARFDTAIGAKSTTDLSEGTNLYYTDARVDARVGSVTGANLSLSNKTTDDLSEGTTNLYYTNARVRSEITGASLDMGSNNITTTGKMLYANMYATVASLPSATTYHGMFAHVHATNKGYFAHSGGWKTLLDETSSTTTDLTEGTNLYYTNARARSAISGTGSLSYDSTTGVMSFTQGDTDSISEGTTNLYYTDARVDARITNAGAVTQSDIDTAISNLVDSSPATLDTLNELAAALGDDANFSTTITNSIATKLAITDFTSTANTWIATKSTTNLTEGTNLYYTDARADARISSANIGDLGNVNLTTAATTGQSLVWNSTNSEFIAGDSFSQSDFNTAFTAKSTTDLSEGTNLYFTTARVNAAVTTALLSSPVAADLDDEIFDREQADADLQTQINGITSYSGFNTDFASKSTTDLSEGTNLYYTDARVRSEITGASLDMGSNTITTTGKMLFENMYAQVADLPAAGTYHGMFAHVHATNKGYFAHGGNWITLIDETSSTTTDLSEGTNLYYTDARVQSKLGTVSGDIIPDTNITYDLGSTTHRFKDLYLSGSSISLGDATLSSEAGGAMVLPTDSKMETTPTAVTNSTIIATTAYVTSAVAALVDSSPATLNTLNELAAALDDDANYATTVTTALGTKLNLSGGTMTGALDMGSNNVTTTGKMLYANMYAQVADLPAAATYHGMFAHVHATQKGYFAHAGGWKTLIDESSSTTTDLSEGTNLYYTNARVRSEITGADLDMGSNNITTTGKMLFENMYAQVADLPAAATYHGMFAHVHATNKGYFAHGGNWITLIDESSSTTTDLSEGTNLYYTDARVRTEITGAALDMGSNTITTTGKMLFENMYATEADLPAAGTYHGMFAHVHNTNKGYFAHGGNWIKLIDESSSTTTDLSEGTNLYYTDARVDARITASGSYSNSSVDSHVNVSSATSNQVLSWNGTDYVWVAQSGGVSAIDGLTDVDITTNAPTNGQTLVWNAAGSKFLPGTITSGASSIDALTDVDITTNAPTNGQTLVWNAAGSKFLPDTISGGGTSISVSDTAPTSPSANALWLNSINLKLFIYYNDGTSSQWVEAAGGSGLAGSLAELTNVHTTTPTDGQVLTWDNTNSYWKPADASGGGGGSSVTVSDTAPSTPSDGDMWFNSLDTKLYIRYNDGSSSQWVQSHVDSAGGSSDVATTWAEKSTAYTVVAGEKLFVDCSAAAVTVTLPATGTLGDEIRIVDATGNSATNNITIARNGHKIQGDTTDLIINTNRAAFGLAYYNAAQGWLIMEK